MPDTALQSTPVHKAKVVRPGEGECVWMTGNQYTFQAVAEDTGGSYTLFEGVIPPGAGPPPHSHSREVEGIYVLQGELTFYVEDETFQLGPGCFINLPQGVVHSFKNQGVETARMLDLVAPSGMENFIRETGRPVTDRSARPAKVTREDIDRVTAVAPKYGIEIVLRKHDS
jgi:quercetin dioxygenase-like cupin family protein